MNIKKVKIVPTKERVSLFTFNSRIGVANTQPIKYKKGINIIVDNNFEFKKNNFIYIIFILLKKIFILVINSFTLF